jgi:hypothetical protein
VYRWRVEFTRRDWSGRYADVIAGARVPSLPSVQLDAEPAVSAQDPIPIPAAPNPAAFDLPPDHHGPLLDDPGTEADSAVSVEVPEAPVEAPKPKRGEWGLPMSAFDGNGISYANPHRAPPDGKERPDPPRWPVPPGSW